MADHRTFLRSLDPATRAHLTTRRDLPGLIHLGIHVGLILALAVLVGFGVRGWQLLMFPLGILLVFLFTLLHETSHATVFRSLRMNVWTARIAGYVLLMPPQWFRYFHFAHHKHTHDPALDPELASPKPRTMAQYVIHVSGFPLWKGTITTLWTTARGTGDDPYVPKKSRWAVQWEAAIMLAVYAHLILVSFILQTTLLVWVWILPMILGQPFLRLYLLAEHTLCPHSDNMFENTRTTFTTRAIRWLAWNMPYHAEHHAFPTVPFHQLPALHELTKQHLRTTSDGYAAFHAEYRATF